jgi:hypothetical protein
MNTISKRERATEITDIRVAVRNDGTVVPHVVVRLNDGMSTLSGDVADNLTRNR